jgi:hypothetical protein
MVTLAIVACAVGLLVGETLRDALYPPPPHSDDNQPANSATPGAKPFAWHCKWQVCSGVSILLQQKLSLPADRLHQLIN